MHDRAPRGAVSAVLFGISLWGCSHRESGNGPAPKAPELTVEETEARLARGAIPVDANTDATRRRHGILPNAVLLTSSSEFDVDAELPREKSRALIFYCGDTMCGASDSAAERAMLAGYTDVSVMRAGIRGWVAKGKATVPPAGGAVPTQEQRQGS